MWCDVAPPNPEVFGDCCLSLCSFPGGTGYRTTVTFLENSGMFLTPIYQPVGTRVVQGRQSTPGRCVWAAVASYLALHPEDLKVTFIPDDRKPKHSCQSGFQVAPGNVHSRQARSPVEIFRCRRDRCHGLHVKPENSWLCVQERLTNLENPEDRYAKHS